MAEASAPAPFQVSERAFAPRSAPGDRVKEFSWLKSFPAQFLISA